MVGDFPCSSYTTRSKGIPIPRLLHAHGSKRLQYTKIASAMPKTSFVILPVLRHQVSFKKLDIIAFPDFSAGAMENTAAITYRELCCW